MAFLQACKNVNCNPLPPEHRRWAPHQICIAHQASRTAGQRGTSLDQAVCNLQRFTRYPPRAGNWGSAWAAASSPAICNCNRAILAPIPSWAGSLQSVIAICNCNRVTLQLQPGICNCSRASAIVTENAHAHMKLELRLSISIIPVGYTILCIQTVGGVGWGACCRPLRGRFWDDLFLAPRSPA